jgi:hypothetical protein
MRCGDYAVQQVLVGLHRVGIVGLRAACEKVAASGLDDREAAVGALLEELAADNYFGLGQEDDYRLALWREYLRFLDRPFDEFFSCVQVTVSGGPGDDRDRLIELLTDVLADFELRPDVELIDADDDSEPRLVIGGSTVARGVPSRRSLKATIRHRLSDW